MSSRVWLIDATARPAPAAWPPGLDPHSSLRGSTRKQYVAWAPSLTSSMARRLPGSAMRNQAFSCGEPGCSGAIASHRHAGPAAGLGNESPVALGEGRFGQHGGLERRPRWTKRVDVGRPAVHQQGRRAIACLEGRVGDKGLHQRGSIGESGVPQCGHRLAVAHCARPEPEQADREAVADIDLQASNVREQVDPPDPPTWHALPRLALVEGCEHEPTVVVGKVSNARFARCRLVLDQLDRLVGRQVNEPVRQPLAQSPVAELGDKTTQLVAEPLAQEARRPRGVSQHEEHAARLHGDGGKIAVGRVAILATQLERERVGIEDDPQR